MCFKLAILATGVFLLALLPSAFAQVETVYEEQCAGCHATDGAPTEAGEKLGVTDLRSQFVQDLTNEELFNGIAFAKGHKNYPHGFARRGMTDQQIYDLVQYIRDMPKQTPRRIPRRK